MKEEETKVGKNEIWLMIRCLGTSKGGVLLMIKEARGGVRGKKGSHGMQGKDGKKDTRIKVLEITQICSYSYY